MTDILPQIWAGFAGASWLEQVATVLGVIGVVLMMRQNVWTFPVSLVQVTIFGYVCFAGRLYSETALQGMFFVALVYGWVHWTRPRPSTAPLVVRWLRPGERLSYIAGTLLLWLGWGAVMQRLGAAAAFADAFVFATSVTAQWLQARKRLDNWLGWVIANTVAIGVFWTKGYYWFAVLYLGFWFLAWGGFFAWRRSMGPVNAVPGRAPRGRADARVEESPDRLSP